MMSQMILSREGAKKSTGKERRSSKSAVPGKTVWCSGPQKLESDHETIYYFLFKTI